MIDVINYVFLAIFGGEAALKIICMGCNFFKDNWNCFDFFIVCLTCTTLILQQGNIMNIGSGTSILRVFRLGRVFRLINRAKSLRMIFNTFLITLPSLANIGCLLLLVIFIYSILGVELFAYIRLQKNLTVDCNFQNFGYSFITLLRVSTGEGWNAIQDDLVRQM